MTKTKAKAAAPFLTITNDNDGRTATIHATGSRTYRDTEAGDVHTEALYVVRHADGETAPMGLSAAKFTASCRVGVL